MNFKQTNVIQINDGSNKRFFNFNLLNIEGI